MAANSLFVVFEKVLCVSTAILIAETDLRIVVRFWILFAALVVKGAHCQDI